MRTRVLFLTGLLAATATAAHGQIGGSLGYNVMIFEQFLSENTETNGRLAVGGDARLQNYGVGVSLNSSANDQYNLVVGGTLTMPGGWQVFHGNAYAGALVGPAPTTPNGTTTVGGASPVDFASQMSYYTALSTNLGSQETTEGASVSNSYGTWTFTGTGAGLNIFNVFASEFGGACTVNVNIPTTATAVINVHGASAQTTNCGIYINGGGANGASTTAMAGQVLWNYYNATDLIFRGSMVGSVLAPNANFTMPYGQFVGDFVAKSGRGNTEFYAQAFSGALPPPPGPPPATVTPEPASLLLLGSGLLGLGGAARRRRRRKEADEAEAA